MNIKSDPSYTIPGITLLTLLFLSLPSITSCSNDQFYVEPAEEQNQEYEVIFNNVNSEEHDFRVVRILDNLNYPWAVSWLPDGRLLITERPGQLILVDGDQKHTLQGVPEIRAQGQGGLLDVVVHPEYETNGWIYFTYSSPDGDNTSTTLARAQLDELELTNLQLLYIQKPSQNPGRHYGSRIAFPGDGTVLFTIGERGLKQPAQDLNDPAGSTIRLNEDGSIPSDNPFVGHDDALPEIYSYGHRNAQGMAIHSETGAIWQHEHGPRGGDALNIIQPGANYGWPDATYGKNYGIATPIGIEQHEDPNITNPVTYWVPTSIAPSGMAFYYGEHFPKWQGNLFIGALAEQHLRRLVLEGEEVVHQEVLLDRDIGRVRDVRVGPDGYIYVLTDHSNGALYRIEAL
tara:strand:+ start:77946 stop:79151 length:1206 start_codon:yes stop_codon:yes gene_type:complete